MRTAVSAVTTPQTPRRLRARTHLRAALPQEGVEREVLVVDDGPVADAAPDLVGFDGPRVRVLRHTEPGGVGAARNTGIRGARSGWVAFLDDADVWSPRKLRD